MYGSTLFSRRLFKREIKVHPQQKFKENYAENVENNSDISNSRPTNSLSLNEQQKTKYISYKEIILPSHSRFLTQPRRDDNIQKNTKESKDVISCNSPNNLNVLRPEGSVTHYQQKVMLEGVEFNGMTSFKVIQKGSWFEEIKTICFNLMGKINLFKIMTKKRIV